MSQKWKLKVLEGKKILWPKRRSSKSHHEVALL